MRSPMPSKSIVDSAFRRAGRSASVSPSRGSGEASPLRSAIAYSECVNVRSTEASENQSLIGPAWSDAITYR